MSEILKPRISEINHRGLRFIIMDRPSDANMPNLIQQFKKSNVKDVIRVCEPTYNTSLLEASGIQVHDWQFDDGSPPPQEIINKWFSLVEERHEQDENACFAVHCVAGLGRGPVMVALALMESGMDFEDTVELVREKRRGAFNQKQLKYLSSYKPRNRLRGKKSECSIM